MKQSMSLTGKVFDELILKERSEIHKYLLGEENLEIEIDKTDEKVTKDMEEDEIWLKRPPSKKILE